MALGRHRELGGAKLSGWLSLAAGSGGVVLGTRRYGRRGLVASWRCVSRAEGGGRRTGVGLRDTVCCCCRRLPVVAACGRAMGLATAGLDETRSVRF
uniref:Uncharacterized protein n=1 Tax=Oryza glumipatula TaxID=40148 RepID=A0A0D9YT73_9ORYZ